VAPITFAHRGGRPDQNTLPAFERSLGQGARGLESDARLSSDGEAVLVHDPVVRRGGRRFRVDRTDATALARVDVPRLADLYETLGSDYELSLDVKVATALDAIVRVADRFGARQRLWLCLFSLDALRDARARYPDVRLVHSARRLAAPGGVERHAADLAAVRVDAANLHFRAWSAGLVELFHRFAVRAFAWDVQEVRHLRAAVVMGIDGLYSDHVDRMVATVAEWSGA
jgi:glycerophosphoryl diester phosphodiesterase